MLQISTSVELQRQIPPVPPLLKGGTQYPGILELGQSSSRIKRRYRRGRLLIRLRIDLSAADFKLFMQERIDCG